MTVSNKLTAGQVKAARPQKTPYKMADGFGMYLRVSPTGHRSWRRDFRDADGRRKTTVLGEYPTMSLSEARDAAASDRGVDRRQVPTFGECAERYWNGRQDVKAKTRQAALRALELNLKHCWDKQVNEVDVDDLMAGLNRMNERGKFDYTRKVRRYAGQVLRWAGNQRYVTGNPVELIKPRDAFGRRKVKHFPSIKPERAGELMRGLISLGDSYGPLACRFLALTWVRTTEMREMQWSEIDGNMWKIPESRMKQLYGEDQEDHWVPLSTQAQALLEKLWRLRISETMVFPNSRYPHDRPASENIVLAALKRAGFKGEMSGHGFRALGSTWAYERDRDGLVIEATLAHKDDNNSRAPYNRARYINQRQQLLQDYADWLDLQERQYQPPAG